MAEPVSAISGHLAAGLHGPVGTEGPGVTLTEAPIGALWQVAAWPDRLAAAGAGAAAAAGAKGAPGPGGAVTGQTALLLRTEALKYWIVADTALPRPDLSAGDAAVLDLGHARTRIRLAGPAWRALMARLVPLDLRAEAFPDRAVASTALHHVGVTLMRRGDTLDLYIPRSFALSLVEHVIGVGAQFGLRLD